MAKSRTETAEHCMVPLVPTALIGTTCADALHTLRAQRYDYADCIVILDAQRHVVGAAPTNRIATCDPQTLVERVMEKDIPCVALDVDQERVASMAIGSPLAMIPVVDAQQRFMGIVPPGVLLGILRHEHVEDLLRLAGVAHETSFSREALESPPTRRARHRLPWLLVGLAGSVVAAWIMAHFEVMLRERVAVAFFIPGIVYLADAIGTQTEAITVRGLSLSHLHIGQLLGGEVVTGLLIGLILGVIGWLGVWAVMQDLRLALAVGVSLAAAGGIATVIGLLLPWLFHGLGFDPAYGSGPLGTVTQDVLSLLVYFGALSALL